MHPRDAWKLEWQAEVQGRAEHLYNVSSLFLSAVHDISTVDLQHPVIRLQSSIACCQRTRDLHTGMSNLCQMVPAFTISSPCTQKKFCFTL